VLASADPDVDDEIADVEHHVLLPRLFARRFETPRSLLHARALGRVLATCDIVHGIVERYMPLVAMACRRDQPYVQTAHGTWAVRPFQTRARALFTPALRRVSLLVCQSRTTRDAVARHVALPPHIVLPGGVRIEAFTTAEMGCLPPWIGDAPVVLSVGAIKPRKGFDVLLHAMARARIAHKDAHLVIIGHGGGDPAPCRELQELAARLDMIDHCHFIGGVTNAELAAWYRRADVCALLSRSGEGSFEGLGLVHLEAAAAGTPSIGTYGSGAEDAIVHEATGLLVPQDDADQAAAAVVRLLGDRGLRDRMGAAARSHAASLCWDRLAASLIEHYRRLAGIPTAADRTDSRA
jgi:phosphatidylinositol alpha-1,6-mannosyltransferase